MCATKVVNIHAQQHVPYLYWLHYKVIHHTHEGVHNPYVIEKAIHTDNTCTYVPYPVVVYPSVCVPCTATPPTAVATVPPGHKSAKSPAMERDIGLLGPAV